MTSEFPDTETVRTVLSMATQAPAVGDTRPHWRVAAESLHLYSGPSADPSRSLPRTDPDRREFLVSCGAALHHCTVALAAAGWRATVHRLPDPADPHHLAAVTVTPQNPDDLDVTLASAVARRRTDRPAFTAWPVQWGDIALMGARAARAGVMLRQLEPDADNGVVLALGTESDDGLARLRAGEATSLVLLSATAMGLATCPVAEPLEIPETRETVRADVFGANGFPQMLMRVGWAPVDDP